MNKFNEINMKKILLKENGQDGFVLITSMLMLLALTLIGIAANRNTVQELKISGNDKLHKQTFTQADGGTEVGIGVLKQSVSCISGFSKYPVTDGFSLDGILVPGSAVNPPNLWLNYGSLSIASDTNRDFYFPENYASGDDHTNVTLNGLTELTAGAALEMLAGYEGKGKALGTDGAFLEFQISAQRLGVRNSESNICINYRLDNQFLSNPAAKCFY